MSKIIMGIQLDHRQNSANEVQALLSDYGCYIRTRLGVHEANEDLCSEKGIIILEFVNSKQEFAKELEAKLNQLSGVTIKTMEF